MARSRFLPGRYTDPDTYGTAVVAQPLPVTAFTRTTETDVQRLTENGIQRIVEDVAVVGLRGLMYCLPCTDPTWAELVHNTSVAAQLGFSLGYTPQGDIGANTGGANLNYISYLINEGTQPPQTWSLEAIFYLNAITSGTKDIAGWANAADGTFTQYDRILQYQPTSGGQFSIYQNGTDGPKQAVAGVPAAGQRFHLIATQTGTSLTLYVNGVASTRCPQRQAARRLPPDPIST